MRTMLEGVGSRAAAALHIPQDVTPGEPVITMIGRRNVHIENYHRIEHFSAEMVRLRARTCRVSVCGRDLKIEYYTKEEMMIGGQVASVCMENV